MLRNHWSRPASPRAYYWYLTSTGRKPRGRVADLMIASIVSANRLPLFTTNPAGFRSGPSATPPKSAPSWNGSSEQ